jgi:N-acyl-phosphatidylethanolamine-hydrolysing phospholipase D
MLTQWDGWNVLADPIFSERCSPFQWAGPKRLRPSPVHAADLPPVDVCVISHNHYDHLDLETVKEMNSHHQSLIWMVPLGMKEWMTDQGVHNVVELDWSEKVTISDLSPKNRPPLTIHCMSVTSSLM